MRTYRRMGVKVDPVDRPSVAAMPLAAGNPPESDGGDHEGQADHANACPDIRRGGLARLVHCLHDREPGEPEAQHHDGEEDQALPKPL